MIRTTVVTHGKKEFVVLAHVGSGEAREESWFFSHFGFETKKRRNEETKRRRNEETKKRRNEERTAHLRDVAPFASTTIFTARLISQGQFVGIFATFAIEATRGIRAMLYRIVFSGHTSKTFVRWNRGRCTNPMKSGCARFARFNIATPRKIPCGTIRTRPIFFQIAVRASSATRLSKTTRTRELVFCQREQRKSSYTCISPFHCARALQTFWIVSSHGFF
jgi:hypothetical protein